jgi:DUF1680 family protein
METKMYVTAGLGPSAHNEGFTFDFDLPNQTAYAETCASVALIFWAQRMLHLDLDGKYADVLELALFNGALSGLSRDGEHYFYANPLESNGTPTRWDWHTCPCCTMNVSRLVASVGGYFLSTGRRRRRLPPLWRHSSELEIAGRGAACARCRTIRGRATSKSMSTRRRRRAFDVKLRIPGWSSGAKVSVNGEAVALDPVNGYLTIHRTWGRATYQPRSANAAGAALCQSRHVIMDVGRVALKRGPLVYCLEEADNPGGTGAALKLPREAELRAETRADLFDGVVTLKADALAIKEGDWKTLYRTAPPQDDAATITALPYYLWANRGQGSMVVWVPEVQ